MQHELEPLLFKIRTCWIELSLVHYMITWVYYKPGLFSYSPPLPHSFLSSLSSSLSLSSSSISSAAAPPPPIFISFNFQSSTKEHLKGVVIYRPMKFFSPFLPVITTDKLPMICVLINNFSDDVC